MAAIARKIAPKTDSSELSVADCGTAGHVNAVAKPDGAVGVTLWFQNGSGTLVHGRIGFAGEDVTGTLVTTTTADGKMGHHPAGADSYHIPMWAKYIHLASSTANAVVLGTWYYD